MKKLINYLFDDDISLKNIHNKYQYYQTLNNSLKKELPNNELNSHWDIVTVTNNNIIIFTENNLYAAKLNKIIANNFDNWNKKYNYNFSSYQIKVYPKNIKTNIKKNFYISEESQKLLSNIINKIK